MTNNFLGSTINLSDISTETTLKLIESELSGGVMISNVNESLNLSHNSTEGLRLLWESSLSCSDDSNIWEQIDKAGAPTVAYVDSSQTVKISATNLAVNTFIQSKVRINPHIFGDITVLMEADLRGASTSVFSNFIVGVGNDPDVAAADRMFFNNDDNGLVAGHVSEGSAFSDPQDEFSLDVLDGTGNPDNPSGVLINAETNAQVFVFTWNNRTDVKRFGILHNGRTIYCHEVAPKPVFGPAEDTEIQRAWRKTAFKPYFHFNISVGDLSELSMIQGKCAAYVTNNGTARPANGYFHSAPSNQQSYVDTNAYAIAAIRYSDVLTNAKYQSVHFHSMSFNPDDQSDRYLLVFQLNPTIDNVSNPQWLTPTGSDSCVQFLDNQLNHTISANGTILFSQAVTGNSGLIVLPEMANGKLGDGDVMAVTMLAASGIVAFGTFNWVEGRYYS